MEKKKKKKKNSGGENRGILNNDDLISDIENSSAQINDLNNSAPEAHQVEQKEGLQDNVTSNADGPWEHSKQHMRSFEHRNKGPIRGTAAAGNVKGAFRNARDMFVFRIQPYTDDAELRNWIEEKGVTLLDFHKVSHPDSRYKSFKITVSVTDYMFLCDFRQWPEGVW